MTSESHKNVDILEKKLSSLLKTANIIQDLQLKDLFSSEESQLTVLKRVLVEWDPNQINKVDTMQLTEVFKALPDHDFFGTSERNPAFLKTGSYSELLSFWIFLFSIVRDVHMSASLKKKEEHMEHTQREESWMVLEKLCNKVQLPPETKASSSNMCKPTEVKKLNISKGTQKLCNKVQLPPETKVSSSKMCKPTEVKKLNISKGTKKLCNKVKLAPEKKGSNSKMCKPMEVKKMDISNENQDFEYRLDESHQAAEKVKQLANNFSDMHNELGHLVDVSSPDNCPPKDSSAWLQLADRTEELSQFLTDFSTVQEAIATSRSVMHDHGYVENQDLCDVVADLALLSGSLQAKEE